MNALRALLSNRDKPIDLELCFMTGEGEVVLGHHVPILSAWNALRIKEIKVLQVLLCPVLTISVYLALGTLLGMWSCRGDCAATLSHTFITAIQAGERIYSSTGCACCTHYSFYMGVEAEESEASGVMFGVV